MKEKASKKLANGQNIDYSEKENGPRASSAPALGLNTIIFKHVYWYMYMQQILWFSIPFQRLPSPCYDKNLILLNTFKDTQNFLSPLCLVWVRSPLWPHVRQAKFCLRVCQVFILGVLPFSPLLLIGPSHMS